MAGNNIKMGWLETVLSETKFVDSSPEIDHVDVQSSIWIPYVKICHE